MGMDQTVIGEKGKSLINIIQFDGAKADSIMESMTNVNLLLKDNLT